MAELARESARTGEVTFEEATAFSHECQRFAVEAATLRSRDELGAKFDAQSSETASHIRDNLQMIVRAHVPDGSVRRETYPDLTWQPVIFLSEAPHHFLCLNQQ